MVYELWDLQSGNLIRTFDSEPAALAFVRSALQEHGRAYAETLGLSIIDPKADDEQIIDGSALVRRAQLVHSAG